MSGQRSVWMQLDPARRAAVRRLHALRPAKNVYVAPFAAMWSAAAVIATTETHWAVRIPAYVLAGVALHALAVFMHEAVHGNLFRNRRVDRWVGFVLGAPGLLSASAYRVTHLLHHRDTRGERDPDEFTNHLTNPRLLSLAFYAWAFLGMFVFLIHVPVSAWRLGTRDERRAIAIEYSLLFSIYGTVIAIAATMGAMNIVLHGWLIPLGVALVIVNVRGWAEHMLTEPGDPFTHTRTVTSNRLVSFLLLNLNYHVEHHLFPGVPWYNIPKLHRLLEQEYRAHRTPIYRSYVRFLCDAVRVGFHGLAPERAKLRGNA